MANEPTIVSTDTPEWGVIGGGINEFNNQQVGLENSDLICYILKMPDDEVVGGVIGITQWNWFFLNLMWIREDYRQQGFGSRLLKSAENEARVRGAEKAYLDTFSFQAPGFYEKHGYEIFGELQDFPPGHQRYYMVKTL